MDRRADIWSFGVVLWELLTGKQLFGGDTVSDILASVLKEEPNLEQVPAKVRPLLRRCLEKEPKKRLQAIWDWGLLIADDAPGRPGATTFFRIAPIYHDSNIGPFHFRGDALEVADPEE